MDNVIISNFERFKQIKSELLTCGFDNLHVISDFDRTLTHAFLENGDFVSSTMSILRDENHLSLEYSKKANALFDFYHPIEIDVNVSLDDKKKAMEEWWTKHSDLLIESGLNKSDLFKAAKSKRIRFRENTLESMILLNNNNVPFVILSASGLGDISIIETLRAHKMYLQNVDVISNKYIWDEKGYAINFVKPHIHSFNKNETALKDSLFYPKIKNRKNVILLGDSLGDVKMVEGFEYNTLLKIGFLNFDVEKHLDEYTKHYDVVITNDSSMKFIYDLLKEI